MSNSGIYELTCNAYQLKYAGKTLSYACKESLLAGARGYAPDFGFYLGEHLMLSAVLMKCRHNLSVVVGANFPAMASRTI